MEALGADLLTYDESEIITALFECLYPLTGWGKVEWEKINTKKEIYDTQEIISAVQKMLDSKIDEEAFILTDDAMIPIIKTNLITIFNNFNNVYPLSSYKFIFSLNQGYIIEVLSAHSITIGLADKQRIALCINLKYFLDALPAAKFHNKYETRWINKLLNPFAQPKYWNINEPYCIESALDIIPSVQALLKKSIETDILIIWADKQFPIIETDLEKVIPLWAMLTKIKVPFQIIAMNSSYLIDVDEDNKIKITINFGLRNQ
jgi:hypothetical protein